MAVRLEGRGRVLGSLALAAVGLTGCAAINGDKPDGQIGQTNLVDCANGPREAHYENNLPKNSKLELDYTDHGGNKSYISHLNLISDGEGSVSIKSQEGEILPTFIEDKLVYVSENKVRYEVMTSKGPEATTHIIVDLSCVNPQSS